MRCWSRARSLYLPPAACKRASLSTTRKSPNRSNLQRQFKNTGHHECRERTATRKCGQKLLPTEVWKIAPTSDLFERSSSPEAMNEDLRRCPCGCCVIVRMNYHQNP